MIKKIAIIFITTVLLSSCFTDVIDGQEIKTIDAKTLESYLNNNSTTKYGKVNNNSLLPIIGWVGITRTNLTIENFQRMKDAGININCSYYPHVDSVQKALDLSFQVGIKTLIDCPELTNNTIETVNRFKDHPANAGYFLKDEPSASDVSYYAKLAKLIESIDNTRFCYINLLPTYAGPEIFATSTYNEYIQCYVTEIPLKILSFDHYPIIGSTIRFDWYKNLETIKDESTKSNIPFWAFAMATAHSPYPITDVNQLRLQVYSNLAYGAKGIQYFTYQTPSKNDYHMGPIERDGRKTVVYDYVKEINEEVQSLSSIFSTSRVIKVSHYGDNIPEGTKPFTTAPSNIKSLKIRGGNALISELKSEVNSFFLIQNNNLFNEIGIKIDTDERTYVISKKGYIAPASVIVGEFKLVPGDIVIFMK